MASWLESTKAAYETAEKYGRPHDYVFGANVAGFPKGRRGYACPGFLSQSLACIFVDQIWVNRLEPVDALQQLVVHTLHMR